MATNTEGIKPTATDIIAADVSLLARHYLKDGQGEPMMLSEYQTEIVDDILYKRHDKLQIVASRQAGKSQAIAAGVLLAAICHGHETIVIVSATKKQAKIIFDYVAQFIGQNRYLYDKLDRNKPVNQEQITFSNFSIIKILTAGGAAKGEGLLGQNATILVIDESGSIEDGTYRTKILPMLSAKSKKRKILVESGTPHRPNHFLLTWNDKDYHKIWVPYTRAIKSGRLNETYIESMRKTMSHFEFSSWYEAEFPEMGENSLFSRHEIEAALTSVENPKCPTGWKIVFGCDIARMGNDRTVISICAISTDGRVVQLKIVVKVRQALTSTAGDIINLTKEWHPEHIFVDDNGVGGGVTDILRENDETQLLVVPIIAGRVSSNPERYKNIKAEYYLKLKSLFEQKKIVLLNRYEQNIDLMAMKRTSTEKGATKIVDPDQSPDFADALTMCLYPLLGNQHLEPMMLGLPSGQMGELVED